jgi:predicted transcriptional regulator
MKNSRYAFILIADEKYWNRLCERNSADREVHVFVRKNQVGPCKAQKLLFYVKKPVMQVRGVADFIERLTGNSKALWEKYGAESCFESYSEYAAFAEGREKMTFVRFKNFTELKEPKPTEIARIVIGSLRWFRPKYLSFEAAQQLVT